MKDCETVIIIQVLSILFFGESIVNDKKKSRTFVDVSLENSKLYGQQSWMVNKVLNILNIIYLDLTHH